MRGGSVVLATSPFDVQLTQTLAANKVDSGLKDCLDHYGLAIEDSMVLDTRNAALPVPVQRYLGGLPVREIRMLPYPHFPDLRDDSLNQDSPITASLQQLTLNWVSPVDVDAAKNKGRKVTELLKSSEHSWTSADLNVVPDFAGHPDGGFAVSGERKPRVLAVALEGRFDSFYRGKDSPLAKAAAEEKKDDKKETPGQPPQKDQPKDQAKDQAPTSVIEASPESAKLVLVASNSFATDAAINLASEGVGTYYTKPMEFLQNVIDWSLEDPSLLSLRGRTQLARTLAPLSENGQRTWEYINYALALAGLAVVWAWRRMVAGNDRRRYQRILAEV
jgi:ABC-2 type transport system permease protein